MPFAPLFAIKNEVKQVAKDAEKAREETERQRSEIYQAESRLIEPRAQIVTTDETVMLQQAGVYAYRHQLHDAVAYRSRLDSLKAEIKAEIKDLARGNRAVLAATDWTVNGSAREGRKMVRDFSELMLRAHNAEAEYAVRTMRPHRLASLVTASTRAGRPSPDSAPPCTSVSPTPTTTPASANCN